MSRSGILFLIVFLLAASPDPHSSAAIYTWTDPGGVVHFSDNLDDVPPALRKDIKVITEPDETAKERAVFFERTAAGLIVVEAILNDRVKAKMILDTGANLVVITEGLSRKLGQDLSSGEETVKLHTQCGEVEGKLLVIPKIALEGARKENVRAVITPDTEALRGYDGLLGLSFLGDFKIAIDYQKGKLLLSK